MEKNIYSHAKISVRVLDIIILVGFVALVVVTVYLSVMGGFNIRFDSRGGSEVDTQRLRYGESVLEPSAPTREGYVFLGWYSDEALTKEVDVANMTATQSITLYALWAEE